jgi:hypothetical protein
MGNTYYKPDEAIEKWASMRENMPKYFRWTPRRYLWMVVSCIIIPSGLWWGIKRDFETNDDPDAEHFRAALKRNPKLR